MDTFAANYLAELTASLSAQMLNVAGRKLRQSLQGTEGEQALQRAVQAGVLALLATASGAAPEETDLLEDIFSRFFAEPDVALELAMLLRGQALDEGALSDLFSDAGFDTETLPGVDFEQGLAAFEAAFLLSAADESTLRDIVATGQLLAQTRLQGEIVAILREMVNLLQRTGGSSISVRRGTVIAQGGSVAGGRESINVGGAVYGGITIVHQHAPTSKPDFIQAYCEALRQRCNVLPLAALGGEEDAGEEVTLDEVYIALDTTTRVRQTGGKSNRESAVEDMGREERPETALEAATRHHHLALLGDPGGGKSTFVRQLAARLAEAHSGREAIGKGWEPGLLPVVTTLRELAARVAGLELQGLSQDGSDQLLVETVWEQWRHDLKYETRVEGFAGDLEQALRAGNVLLIFDGLDEVTLALRPLVRKALAALQRHYPQVGRLIVTCRIRSYIGNAVLPGFTAATLAPFDTDQIRSFCTAWYAAQGRLGRVKQDQAGMRIRDFQAAALSDDFQDMASNPMLLTTMAIIHQRDIGLPKERVRLFNEAVKVLIGRWQKHKGIAAPAVLAAVLADDLRLRRILEMIAYEAHQIQAKQGPDARLSRVELLTLLEKPAFLGDMNCAVAFLDYVDQRAGLLVGYGGDEEGEQPLNYDFAHRSFQEYLAGRHMVSQGQPARTYWQRVAEGDFWHQAGLYGAEDLLFNRQLPPALLNLAYRLCPAATPTTEADWRALVWSGQMAALLDKETIREDDQDRDGGAVYLERLLHRLQDVLTKGRLNPVERVDAGKALAALGDPRKGVGLRPDRLPDIDWVLVPEVDPRSGRREFIYQRDEKRVEPDFWIARYPITYAQFQAFLDSADGFHNAQWWQGLAADKDHRRSPGEQRFQHWNHPRERVSWYDAIAFCRWLAAQAMATPDLLPVALRGTENWQITLPTEWQWEKAARGHEGRQYPWGEDYQSGRANVDEISGKSGPYYLQQTSAVGMYPHAAPADSPYGVADLSGNVWEWCLNEYSHPDRLQTEGGETRVLRGGSWIYPPDYAASAFRYRYSPYNRYYGIGFRVVVRVASLFPGSAL